MTPKQQRFVEEYLIDLNATQAAVRAGYSAKTAEQQGPRLLGNVGGQAAIQAAKQARSNRTEITADRVLEELAKIGFANAGDYFDWSPDGIMVKSKEDLTREQQAAVAEISETTTQSGGTVRIKLHDKIGALEKIGKHQRQKSKNPQNPSRRIIQTHRRLARIKRQAFPHSLDPIRTF